MRILTLYKNCDTNKLLQYKISKWHWFYSYTLMMKNSYFFQYIFNHSAFTCSNSTIETLEQGIKSV